MNLLKQFHEEALDTRLGTTKLHCARSTHTDAQVGVSVYNNSKSRSGYTYLSAIFLLRRVTTKNATMIYRERTSHTQWTRHVYTASLLGSLQRRK